MQKSCLLVDDSKVIRSFMKKMFHELHFEVSEAENGQDAIEKIQKTQYDLIMLDWNMPVMDGIEFMKKFKTEFNHQDTKVIFCTTESEMNKIQIAIELGASEYIMKPFDIEILRSKLIQCQIIE
jgi:two-component system, chemotaxis family, chemotaxis protein CheY